MSSKRPGEALFAATLTVSHGMWVVNESAGSVSDQVF